MAANLMAVALHPKSSLRTYSNETNNNPHKFHLVFTTNSLDYSITYDPRAADEWLFHAGGLIQTNHP
ncbi:MAG TPA: hypothetical protein VN516_04250 [Candidatus Baltobacteraceae bacterium]|nr:hypothetical protein [Candidatus Baltobacteraceae bacterium]